MAFLDSIFDALLPVFDSWITVHVLVALPLVVMLFNFLRGGCDVAATVGIDDALAARNGSSIRASLSAMSFFQSRRTIVALTALAFAWQLHAVWFVSVPQYIFTADSQQHRIVPSAISTELLLFLHATGCAVFSVSVLFVWRGAADERRESQKSGITSFSQHCAGRKKKTSEHVDDEAKGRDDDDADDVLPQHDNTRVSWCPECDRPVVGRDHCCFFLGVCIGKVNRIAFFTAIASAFLFALMDCLLGLETVVPLLPKFFGRSSSHEPVSISDLYLVSGFVFSIPAAMFTGEGFAQQVYLLSKGETMLGAKRRQQRRQRDLMVAEKEKKTA